jgi:hypothetical protein
MNPGAGIATEDELLADRIGDMVGWLEMMVKPVEDWDLVDPNPYRYTDNDVLELGDRVADDLLSEWAWSGDADSAIVLVQNRIDRALAEIGRNRWLATTSIANPEPESLPLGEPGTAVWSSPAYAPFVLPLPVLNAVLEWMRANDVVDASGVHEVRVETHPDGTRTIVYHRGRSPRRWQQPDPTVTEVRLPLRTEPPVLPTLPNLTTLATAIDQHPIGRAHHNLRVPIGSPVCITCTTVENPVLFPCPPVLAAALATGVEVFSDGGPADMDDDRRVG